ncbi:hypothetical protein [Thioalkalivibrio sp. ALJT]|uniref:hypothetical protein n=1 Tax=Thioalkalivibrio sp. ALJT TaxID=1158146 RepID=UPI00039D847A|nr:hypothetical protein [Thioalkalivibrio sp. ALJT]
MKYRNLVAPGSNLYTRAETYFAQLMDEMLFDFTVDTYKPSLMHAGLLAEEALGVLRDVESGIIQKPNIQHVTAEFHDHFLNDPVAQELVPLSESTVASVVAGDLPSIPNLRAFFEIASVHLAPSRYKPKLEESLLSVCLDPASDLALVRRLARLYVTTLLGIGYHQKYIHSVLEERFFREGLDRTRGVQSFLSVFGGDPRKYAVTFRVGRLFDDRSGVFSDFGFEIAQNSPAVLPPLSKFSADDCTNYPFFATIEDVKAKDPYSARVVAEKRLDLIASFLSIYHHGGPADWSQGCYVLEDGDSSVTWVGDDVSPMRKCDDLRHHVATRRLREFLGGFSLRDGSLSKFISSVRLHAMAMKAGGDENQILNLWTALESLVPSDLKHEKVSQIEHIANSVIPFANVGYIEKRLNTLVKDLLRWDNAGAKACFREVAGRKFTHRLGKILALDNLSEVRQELFNIASGYVLLSERLKDVADAMKSPAGVANALDRHALRVEWQIRRIYRTRNMIVHAGSTPPYTRDLIEHCHGYLDVVLEELIELASEPRSVDSVEQGFELIRLRYEMYLRELKRGGNGFSEGGIDRLLFSHSRFGRTEWSRQGVTKELFT